MSIPRKHHYIPKSYLAAWTSDGTIDGQLTVLDKTNGRSWSVKPVNAAVERDLYMIDLEEVEDDIEATKIEKSFGEIEAAAMPSIKSILDGGDFPEGDDRESLIKFLALLALRVPFRLQWIEEVMKGPIEMIARRLEAKGELPKSGDEAVDKLFENGFRDGKIGVEIKQNAKLEQMIRMMLEVAVLLHRRHWSVLRVDEGAGDLICCDNPLLLEWIKPPMQDLSPGFGLDNTAVFVPFGPRVAIVGLWGSEPANKRLSDRQVASWNGELLGCTDRFAFAVDQFSALRKNGSIDQRDDVLELWKNKAENK